MRHHPTGSGWISVRLNKEPPEDSAVVEYIGVGEPNLSAMPMPLANLGAPPRPAPNPPDQPPEDETDLAKIKNGGLTEDDNCTICMTRKLRGNQSTYPHTLYGDTRKRMYEMLFFVLARNMGTSFRAHAHAACVCLACVRWRRTTVAAAEHAMEFPGYGFMEASATCGGMVLTVAPDIPKNFSRRASCSSCSTRLDSRPPLASLCLPALCPWKLLR